jgi:hypothetical protein
MDDDAYDQDDGLPDKTGQIMTYCSLISIIFVILFFVVTYKKGSKFRGKFYNTIILNIQFANLLSSSGSVWGLQRNNPT